MRRNCILVTLPNIFILIAALFAGPLAYSHGGGMAPDSHESGDEQRPDPEQKRRQAEAQDAGKFSGEMHSQIMRSMGELQFTRTTGNVDRDFGSLIITHNQGAIEMAELELKYGKDPQMRTIAQKIVEGQRSDNKTIKEWIDKNRSLNSK